MIESSAFPTNSCPSVVGERAPSPVPSPLPKGRLEFGHSGGPELSERHSVLLGGGGSYQGLVGDRCLSGGKGRRVVNQLLAQQRDQIQTGGSLGSAAPFGQGRIDFGPFGSVAFQAG